MLLNKEQIAARFGTSSDLARATLAENGVMAIDFGRGRGRGPRWYSEAVDAVILKLHKEAQAKEKVCKTKVPCKEHATVSLASMAVPDIYVLTRSLSVQ